MGNNVDINKLFSAESEEERKHLLDDFDDHLLHFTKNYFNLSEDRKEISLKEFSEIRELVKHTCKLDNDSHPIRIGKGLFLNYKCDGTWLGSKNPSSLDDDAIPTLKGKALYSSYPELWLKKDL